MIRFRDYILQEEIINLLFSKDDLKSFTAGQIGDREVTVFKNPTLGGLTALLRQGNARLLIDRPGGGDRVFAWQEDSASHQPIKDKLSKEGEKFKPNATIEAHFRKKQNIPNGVISFPTQSTGLIIRFTDEIKNIMNNKQMQKIFSNRALITQNFNMQKRKVMIWIITKNKKKSLEFSLTGEFKNSLKKLASDLNVKL